MTHLSQKLEFNAILEETELLVGVQKLISRVEQIVGFYNDLISSKAISKKLLGEESEEEVKE